MVVTISDVRNVLIANGNEAADYLSNENLEKAVFWNELKMDSLDFEDLKGDIEYEKNVIVPNALSLNDTVKEFIDRINGSNL